MLSVLCSYYFVSSVAELINNVVFDIVIGIAFGIWITMLFLKDIVNFLKVKCSGG